jgi:Leucine-rich repeat (LRR) protein
LFGTIPESVGNWTYLEHLDLSVNALHGPLPTNCWPFLSHLIGVILSENVLTGPIPDTIGAATNVQLLEFSNNHLNGTSAAQLCTLPNLVSADISKNFFSGTIPSCLGSMTQLEYLVLGVNEFHGPIPAVLESLTQLTNLDVSRNFLTGTIPLFVCGFLNMSELYFGRNSLTGTLPDCLGELSSLRVFGVEYNDFTGTAPASLAQLTRLVNVWLNYNQLSGEIPNFAVQPKMEELLLYNNGFTGSIPDCFGDMTILAYLSMSTNFLTGRIPASMGLPAANYIIDLSENLLTGSIPTTFSGLRSLVQLFVQHNFLGGSLNGVFNASLQFQLFDVLVHQNQFTGTLPGELLRLNRMDTLIASENCFSGTLTTEICSNAVMVSLILDGLHTSKACRKPLLPAAHAYGVSSSFHGTIPPCLLQLPRLASLHLSGNGLTGTLPENVTLSTNMLDLTVSHNALTGTIPNSVQLHNWRTLDLSFNRLRGSLTSAFGAGNLTLATKERAISIQNNRLSGSVPHPLVHLQNVSSLGSNLFSCKVDKSDLPQHDSDFDIYQCASDAFDGPYYVFIGMCLIIVAVMCIRLRGVHDLLVEARNAVYVWIVELKSAPRSIAYVLTACDILCQLSIYATLMIVVVLVPWYAAASHYYGTYTHQYAWVVSAAFLSGTVPTVVNLALYCLLMVGAILGSAVIVIRRDKAERNHNGSPTRTQPPHPTNPAAQLSWKRYLVYAAFLTFNLFVVAGANAGFVSIALSQSNFVVVLAQVLLSAFKLTWNTVCTPFLIYLVKEIIAQKSATASLVTVQVFLALFNNIAIPCMVVAVLSPSCFYSVFDPPGKVTSNFVVQGCYVGTAGVYCSFKSAVHLTASFSPPFKYDYQCSSSFVTYYAPAFVYLGLAAAFAAPLAKIAGMHLLHRASPGTRWYSVLVHSLPTLLLPPCEPVKIIDESSTQSMDATSPLSSVSQSLVSLWRRYCYVFDANNFIVTLITYLGILLTFGVVFPLLAVVMCVAILSVTWQTKLEVGRYMHRAKEKRATHLIGTIENECKNAVSFKKLRRGLYIIICFCCGFYALFLYDMLGNAVGQHSAVWVLWVMLFFPVGVYAAIRAQRMWRKDSARQLGFSVDGEMVEMSTRASNLGAAGIAMEFGGTLGRLSEETEAKDQEKGSPLASETFNAILKL